MVCPFCEHDINYQLCGFYVICQKVEGSQSRAKCLFDFNKLYAACPRRPSSAKWEMKCSACSSSRLNCLPCFICLSFQNTEEEQGQQSQDRSSHKEELPPYQTPLEWGQRPSCAWAFRSKISVWTLTWVQPVKYRVKSVMCEVKMNSDLYFTNSPTVTTTKILSDWLYIEVRRTFTHSPTMI